MLTKPASESLGFRVLRLSFPFDSGAAPTEWRFTMRIQIRIGMAAGTLLFGSLMLFTFAQNSPTVNTTDTATTAHLSVGTPAPAGFDNQTNGFVSQTMFDADRAVFEEKESIADGI